MDNTGTSSMICNLYMLYAYHNTETIYLRASVALLARDHAMFAALLVNIIAYTLWLFNIAMENGPFIDGLPIKNGDFPWLC